MGLPITGQHYNQVSFAFYVGKWAKLSHRVYPTGNVRIIDLGVPYYVHFAEDTACKIFGFVSPSPIIYSKLPLDILDKAEILSYGVLF